MISKNIIILTGADGSGKTTTLKYIILKIKSKKYSKYRILWVKSLHTIAFIIFILINKLVYKNRFNKLIYQEWMKKLGATWAIIELLGILPYLILIKVLNKSFKGIIIFDRYIIDFYITVSLRTNKILYIILHLLIIYNIDLLRRSIIIYHKISHNNYKRYLARKMQAIDFDIGTYKKMIILYDIIIKILKKYYNLNIVTVNTLLPRDEVNKTIFNYLNENEYL
ncbi:MAG: hypothetical protein F7C38_05335 [Desulfurococcales archaeon]|nr:hypothetical protein [Desulfurococcales archaeon]